MKKSIKIILVVIVIIIVGIILFFFVNNKNNNNNVSIIKTQPKEKIPQTKETIPTPKEITSPAITSDSSKPFDPEIIALLENQQLRFKQRQ
jgi:uncharacterized protein YxeA